VRPGVLERAGPFDIANHKKSADHHQTLCLPFTYQK
jgi:hypothetical protein